MHNPLTHTINPLQPIWGRLSYNGIGIIKWRDREINLNESIRTDTNKESTINILNSIRSIERVIVIRGGRTSWSGGVAKIISVGIGNRNIPPGSDLKHLITVKVRCIQVTSTIKNEIVCHTAESVVRASKRGKVVIFFETIRHHVDFRNSTWGAIRRRKIASCSPNIGRWIILV